MELNKNDKSLVFSCFYFARNYGGFDANTKQMVMSPAWITAALSGVIVLNNIVYFIHLQKFKVSHLQKSDEELKQQLKTLSAELAHIATQMKVMMTRQGVINKMSSQTLQGLVRRLEGVEEHLRAWPEEKE